MSESNSEKKKTSMRGKYSENQKNATIKYMNENFEKLAINVRKGKREKIKALAESQGKPMATYIMDLIEADAARLGFDLSIPPTPSQVRQGQDEE